MCNAWVEAIFLHIILLYTWSTQHTRGQRGLNLLRKISTELVGKIIQEIGIHLSTVPQFCKMASGSYFEPNLKTLWEQDFTILSILDKCFVSPLQWDEMWLTFCKSEPKSVESSQNLSKEFIHNASFLLTGLPFLKLRIDLEICAKIQMAAASV